MASEIINYRGYELHLDQQGSGLKASLWQHGIYFIQPQLPFFPDGSRREQLISDAKAAVDSLLDPLLRTSH